MTAEEFAALPVVPFGGIPADGRSFAEPPDQPPPCLYLGPIVNRAGQVRQWRECGLPALPLGPLVCSCRGCGPKCPGYAPAAE